MDESELVNFLENRDITILDINSNDIPKSLPVIYFLFNGDELVYVGETINLERRLCQHHTKWNCCVTANGNKIDSDLFDKVWYFETFGERRKRWELEQDLIKTFSAKCNDYGWREMALYDMLTFGDEKTREYARLCIEGV